MLTWEYPPLVSGGLGRHVAELAPALAEQGLEIHVVVPRARPEHPLEHPHPNLTVHWVDTAVITPQTDIYRQASQANGLVDAAANALWQRVGGFNVIHAHDWLVGFAAIELKLAHRCPLVVTIHATERGRWRNNILPNDMSRKIDSIERNITFEAWRVIACSHYMISELGRLFALPFDKLDMIPNGVHVTAAPPASAEALAAFRANFAAPGQPLIFSVGRLVYEKGYHILLAAMPQVLEAFPTARLVIAGKGPLLDHLKNMARTLNLDDHVYFAGFVTDAERDMFFSVADCAIFPSLYEPFGIVALEAMAFNCPVLASNVGGLVEVVTHDETGTLIYPDDPASAAWGILQVLNNPPASAAHAQTAYRMVVEKYSWQRIAAQTIQVYRRVLYERSQTGW
ncbi:MAG: glycosyltransferase family 4 protein [Anaerolineae bacterium]